jgi:hypothetical protein
MFSLSKIPRGSTVDMNILVSHKIIGYQATKLRKNEYICRKKIGFYEICFIWDISANYNAV